MRTTCTAEQIEDELGELKLRIAKMNARRNAQINLLQKNIVEGSQRNKVYPKSSDFFRKNYLRYPSYYHYPLLYPWKYPSMDNLLDTYYDPDDSFKKSVSFLSEKDLPEAYRMLERKAQSNIIAKLKRFVLDQENEITNEFVDKLIYPRKAAYLPKLNYEKEDLKNKTDTKLYSVDRESPFLKPINKSDNFYKRYNSFMKRILKPFRKTTPLSKINEYTNPISTPPLSTSWKYKRPSPIPKYFPSRTNKPLSPIKSSLDDLDASYLRPWYRYSPMYRNLLYDYEYIPKSYKVPKDVDAIIRDMEFENRRAYPFTSTYPYLRSTYSDVPSTMKYDPYESDSYVKSNLPSWKQYYYTQKLRSKPSHERLVDYYDPYRNFFCDAASIKSDDMSLPPNKEDSEINSIYDDGYSFPESVKSYNNADDVQIIEDYRDLIYDEIIKNLRSQQTRSYLKNRINAGRKARTPTRLFTPGILKNDRSLYNYRITEPTSSYSWNRKPFDYTHNKLSSSDLTPPLESKYNFQKSEKVSNKSTTDDKPKLQDYGKDYKPLLTENKLESSKYDNLSSIENKYSTQKSEGSALTNSPTRDVYSTRKYGNDGLPTEPTTENTTYQYKDSIPINNYKVDNIYEAPNYKFTSLNKPELDIPKNNVNSIPCFPTTKVESPIKENYNIVFEKQPEPVNTTRRNSIFDNKQSVDQPSPVKPSQNSNPPSPKKQPYTSNPPSPVRQFLESSPAPPLPMSRKNSVQYSVRKGSLQTGSIEEEPSNYPKIEAGRRYSKDQTSHVPEVGTKSTVGNPNTDKRLSYRGSIKESIDERKEEKLKSEIYDGYPQYKEVEKTSPVRDYNEDYANKNSYAEESYPNKTSDYNKSQSYQPYQSFDNSTNPQYIAPDADNQEYSEKSPSNETAYQSNYNRYPDTNTQNYNERYYNDQYDPNTGTTYKPYTEEYPYSEKPKEYPYSEKPKEYPQDQYAYSTNYDTKISENETAYPDRSQYPDPVYSIEKRPSDESYYPERSRPTDYEKYKDEDYHTDYYKNSRGTEKRSSNYQNEPYQNTRYREMPPDENYNDDYRYQSQPNYRDDARTGYQEAYPPADANQYPSYDEPRKSFENYSLHSSTEKEPTDTSYPYSKQNSYENPEYPTDSIVESSNDKISENIPVKAVENVKPLVSDSKAKDRKKSLAVEQPREPESPAPEPSPKEVTLSRRTSRATLTLAEQRKAANEKQLADKNKALKSKTTESKFKRTPSMMKSKPGVKKT